MNPTYDLQVSKVVQRLIEHYRDDFDAEGRARLLARNVLTNVMPSAPEQKELARMVLRDFEGGN
jgi:hypothetical protein